MYSLNHLPHQQPNERVLLFLRRHWFTFVIDIFIYGIVAVIPLGIWAAVGFTYPEFLAAFTEHVIMYPLLVLLMASYYLGLWLFLYAAFVDYYLDTWVVTTHRIIDTHQRGLFRREVAEVKIGRIQDVTSEVHGVFPTFLDYGTVFIQTAGETTRFRFMEVPHPNEMRNAVLAACAQYSKEHPDEAAPNGTLAQVAKV